MELHRKSAILFVAVCLTSFSTYPQAENPNPSVTPDPEYFYYGWRGEKVPLTLSTERIGIVFQRDVREREAQDIIAEETRLRFISPREFQRNENLNRLAVVRTMENQSEADVKDTLDALRSLPDVETSLPVFRVGGTQAPAGESKESLLTEYVSVLGPRDIPEEGYLEQFRVDGVEVVSKFDFPGTGEVGYILRVTRTTRDRTGEDSIALANRYHSLSQFKEASPVFAPLYSLETAVLNPTDKY